MLVSAKTIKQITNVSVPTVRHACERAGVVIHPGHLYERDEAVAAVASHADPARIAGHGASGLGNAQSAEISTLASARARAEEARARKLETENARTEGLLVERAAVVAAGCDLIVRVRGALLSVGQRAAPVVSGLVDHQAIADAINAAIREVLAELSDHDLFNEAVLNG